MTIKNRVKQLALSMGVEMHWYNSAQSQDARLLKQLSHQGIDTVIDVGANDGGYGRFLRSGGYTGSILSFEPLADAHEQLCIAAAKSTNWHVAPRMALGDEDSEVEIHLAGNSTSSSILPMEELHALAEPRSRYIGVQRVPLHRLDNVEHEVIRHGKLILLKIDTQGYEMPVLKGSQHILDRVCGVQIELSLSPLYDGQIQYREMINWLSDKGFELWNVMPGFVDQRSGRMLQMDGVFFRST
jgi:FkbM family methyltransferase